MSLPLTLSPSLHNSLLLHQGLSTLLLSLFLKGFIVASAALLLSLFLFLSLWDSLSWLIVVSTESSENCMSCDDVFEFEDETGVNVDDNIINERYCPAREDQWQEVGYARMHFFLPAEMEAYPTTDSTFEHVLKSTQVGKIGLPADIAL
jgi:hypothetical protein